MPGFSPYVQAAQQQSVRQSPYSRYRPNLSGAVTGPTGTGGTGGGEIGEAIADARAQNQVRTQAGQETANIRQQQNNQFVADQSKTVNDYRTSQDNSQGAAQSRAQRTQATELGIDPSSDARTIADTVNKNQVGDMAQTPFNMNPTQPAPSTGVPGQALPNSADVATAAAAAQNAKDGGQDASLANSYSKGYTANQPPTGEAPTGVNPYTAVGAPAPAMPAMPPLTLKMPSPAGVPSPPMTQVSSAAPVANVNAPLKPAQIKPFGVASNQRRRQPVAAPAILP